MNHGKLFYIVYALSLLCLFTKEKNKKFYRSYIAPFWQSGDTISVLIIN